MLPQHFSPPPFFQALNKDAPRLLKTKTGHNTQVEVGESAAFSTRSCEKNLQFSVM
jgi:hypothetical protein